MKAIRLEDISSFINGDKGDDRKLVVAVGMRPPQPGLLLNSTISGYDINLTLNE